MPVMVNVEDIVLSVSKLLASLQLPVLDVTQLALPPGTKEAVTVALGTTAPVLVSRTVTVAAAVHPVVVLLDAATMDLMATVCLGTGAAAPSIE